MTNKTKSIFSLQFPIYLISLLLIILTSCVLSPIYMQVGNDVVFMYTIVPIVLNYAILLFETMYLALVLACVSHPPQRWWLSQRREAVQRVCSRSWGPFWRS